MQNQIENFLKENLDEGFLPISTCKKCMQRFSLTFREVEKSALELGITPLRYKRNQSTISVQNQLKLFNSHVAIIGCGGLGGHISECLARIGIGELSLFDFDVFEEHNLNRQNFSHVNAIGRKKVEVVKEGLEKINPALHVNAYHHKFEPQTDIKKLLHVNIVVDALDNPQTKLELAFTCKKNSIDFVHGAIAGMNGQFSTCNTLEHLYKDGGKGIEASIGNPSFSVTFAASIQSAEVVKLLLSIGETLKEKILITNLAENEFIQLEA